MKNSENKRKAKKLRENNKKSNENKMNLQKKKGRKL
jgi:hypothetical protein